MDLPYLVLCACFDQNEIIKLENPSMALQAKAEQMSIGALQHCRLMYVIHSYYLMSLNVDATEGIQ